jgi:hypothetical protein
MFALNDPIMFKSVCTEVLLLCIILTMQYPNWATLRMHTLLNITKDPES